VETGIQGGRVGATARGSVVAKLQIIAGNKGKEKTYSLIYGLRLYPEGEVQQVERGTVTHQDGQESRVTLHLLEGTREQIKAQLLESIDAFFDIYSDDDVLITRSTHLQDQALPQKAAQGAAEEETGC